MSKKIKQKRKTPQKVSPIDRLIKQQKREDRERDAFFQSFSDSLFVMEKGRDLTAIEQQQMTVLIEEVKRRYVDDADRTWQLRQFVNAICDFMGLLDMVGGSWEWHFWDQVSPFLTMEQFEALPRASVKEEQDAHDAAIHIICTHLGLDYDAWYSEHYPEDEWVV